MYNFTFCNTTAEYEEIVETPFIGDHNFHWFGLWMSAGFGAFATIVSFAHMWLHALHYSRPNEQKHIIRILFMVPVYAVVSFLSYRYYLHVIYFEVLRDCYEAFAIASFFSLICNYLADSLHDQKEFFRNEVPKNWLWPVTWVQKCTGGPEKGKFRRPRSGLTWFNVIYFCVFQYCFIRVAMTITAVVSQAFDRYCIASLSPYYAHVWVVCIEAICVTFAMYAIIQMYYQLREQIPQHKPFAKVLAIKLVIFLSFWQTIILSFLTSSGAISSSPKLASPDIIVGIPAMLIEMEMAIFSLVHLWAYPWNVYDYKRSTNLNSGVSDHMKVSPSGYKGGPLGLKAFFDAVNAWDVIKAVGRGFRWIFVGRRRRHADRTYEDYHKNDNLEMTPSMNKLSNTKTGRYQAVSVDDREATYSLRNNAIPPGTDNILPTMPTSGAAAPANTGIRPTAYQKEVSRFDATDTGYHGSVGEPLRYEPTRPPTEQPSSSGQYDETIDGRRKSMERKTRPYASSFSRPKPAAYQNPYPENDTMPPLPTVPPNVRWEGGGRGNVR